MRIVIFGTGGMARDLYRPLTDALSLLDEAPPVVFATDNPTGDTIHTDDITDQDRTIIALGSSSARRQVAERIKGKPYSMKALTSIVGQNVTLGEGAVLMDFTMITCDAVIGRQFQCNYYSHVSHDCQIGDFVTFGPGVRCNGNVTIGDGAYIGSGALIREKITIGEGATVGMGAVVVKDVPAGVTVVGNPARLHPMLQSR